jgi:hypothetical protein
VLFLRMWNELENQVRIIDDAEIKTPVLVDPGLPAIVPFVVLLCPEGWVMKVLLQEFDLLEKRLLHWQWGVLQCFVNPTAVFDLHQERLVFLRAARFFSSPFMWAIISSAVLKGP